MTDQNLQEAKEIIAVGIAKIVGDYSDNALLINACFLAKERYENKKDTTHLSTTQNIPVQLRLDNEIEVRYSNEDLVERYSKDVQNVVFKNYIVSIVSTVDATLEDVYEHLLKSTNPNYIDTELEKLIRNAWTNDNMLNFLTDPNGLNLTNPKNLNTEFREAFMRYSELRIVRHTILHTEGKLSDKNLQKLQDNLNNTPNDRKHFALANSPLFDNDNKIVLSINHILSLRQYLDRFLMFIFRAIGEKIAA